jgi:predicted RNase H-like nuclease (RuvC/YqgF family)
MASFEKLRLFLERIKSLRFWQRLFGWRSIRALSYDAFEEFSRISGRIEDLESEIDKQRMQISEHEKKEEIQGSRLEDLKITVQKLEEKIRYLEQEQERLNNEKTALSNRIARYEESEESRKTAYEKKVEAVNTIQTSLENERKQLKEKQIQEREDAFEKMKQTWKNHENLVESAIRGICSRNVIEYMEEVPFRGRPDNTIRIAGEFVIFDAKSPASDNLANFPSYLRVQTEQVKKYIRHENVKKDIYLVIPSNTVDVVDRYVHNLGDYNVFIVTLDSLEPIILSLQKIEEYEFAEQMSPEERENICRIIGKFAHTTKRRIQLDGFFTYQFLEILTKVKADLPRDIYDMVEEFEKAEKLNPPQEKRAKQILTDDLIAESEKLGIEAKARLEGQKPEKET